MLLSIFAFGSGFLILFGLDGIITISPDSITGAFIVGMHEGHGAVHYIEELFTNQYTYLTIVLALLWIYIAYLMYSKFSVNPGRFNREGESRLYKALEKRWWFPQLYDWISWKFGYGIAKGVDYFDRNVIDGTVNGLSGSVVGSGESAKYVQTGNVGNYASIVMIGVAAVFVAALILIYYMGGM